MSLPSDLPNPAFFSSPAEKPSGLSLSSLTPVQAPASPDVEEPAEPSEPPVSAQNQAVDDVVESVVPESIVPEPQAQHHISERVLMQELKESLAKALYLDQSAIDVDTPFVEIGLDSIVGVEWVHAINKQYGLSLAATKVYDYPTVRELAEFLQQELGGSVSAPAEPVVAAPVTEIPLPPPQPPQAPAITPPQAADERSSDAIAIIGMSGRYPEAADLHQFWHNLTQAKNSIREVPKDRWDVAQYFDRDPAKPGKIYCKWLGALEDIDCFDPLFFMISPAEAESMDPQHRLFLQEGYKAFEDAGYSPQSLSNQKCGVYMGIMSYEYAFLLQKSRAEISNAGNSFAIGAARIPYFLNLKGPAIPVDTACSSSLVAIHLACQALKHKEVDMALAGGVSLYLAPEPYVGMCAAGMVSPDGQCKTFDDDADGFVPGEGVGGLVLKRLEDAERDGDHIFGTIIGSGINQDGKTNGITAPSVNSQIELERDLYNRYGIDPASISFVETHGTGTKLGDPIELEALSTVFKEWTDRKHFCGLGSVKTNIGHTSAAAGVASVQKMLLCMQHQQLVPSLNFTKPNRHFNFDDSPFYVNTSLKPWDTDSGTPRRAAVSSFGFSGTNAHLVLEEYIAPKAVTTTEPMKTPVAILLSLIIP